ncbi:DNA photolyase [Leptospira congkakensis]|uniref:DNA photolyase n=1 Tax=Leptospira congkakensis TaxID=2484932 RepID=A0A4Z1A847_9LEPT|nr:DNA photolyase [Leptospira congkakensis]TGL87529.1 DNA photolyase [Leptospira congkakensis]TGL89856.1 DNA photolyase [Leptospira congkakensis]TGL95679.1 DNA photolyase [Leptospira congkakensis]
MFKAFSHIYIEESILDHFRTKEILNRFPNAVPIPIRHYKDSFNRNSQNFRIQKESPKLILAEKKDQFLYKGSDFSPNFSYPHFYYNTLALNCIYDCEYCYLQGMFPSANLVLFVNWEDFFSATKEFLDKNKSLYLALSYDTDLLALESFFPATKAWLEFATNEPNLSLEIRTKSTNYGQIAKYPPNPNVILAWTISPQSIIESIEHGTPSLLARLKAIGQAIKDGWQVRICIDPILRVPEWKTHYQSLADTLGKELNIEGILDISIGGFRMNIDFLKRMADVRKDSSILFHDFEKKDKIVSYSKLETEEILNLMSGALEKHFSPSQIKVSYS